MGLCRSVTSSDLAGDFSGGDEVGSSSHARPDRLSEFAAWACLVAAPALFGGVNDGNDETFGVKLRRRSGIQLDFHI